MIKKLILLLVLPISLVAVKRTAAQCTTCTYTPVKMSGCPTTPPKPRGLYVNEFFEFNSPFYGPPMGIDVNHSILAIDANNDGIYEKEDALLAYCKANAFTRITVYDIWNILAFPTFMYGSMSYQDHLKRFITKAKTGGYGITDVGVTIWNPNTPALVAQYNGIVSSCVAAKQAGTAKMSVNYFEAPEQDNVTADIDAEIDLTAVETDDFYNSASKPTQLEKEEQEIATYANAKIEAANSFKIDHMVSEFEFWNTKTFNTVARRDSAYRVFQNMMNYMKCIRAASVDPLYIYVYLGYLDKDSYDDKVQATFIDGIADKIYLSNYKCNPNSLFQASIQSRIDIFSNASGPTKANSKIVILLCGSSQSDAIPTDPLNDGWCDFLGPFLKVSGNSMACAENLFKVAFDNYKTANPNVWNSTLNSFQWYPYTLLKKNSIKRLTEEGITAIDAASVFTAYPNPATSSATFHFTMDEEYLQQAYLDILDLNGRVVIHQSLTGLEDANLNVNLNEVKAGIYLCRVVNHNWTSGTSKLVLMK